MSRRHAIHHRRCRSIGAIILPLLVAASAPAGAQAPTTVSSSTPVVAPDGSTIDPRSATGQLIALRGSLEADRLLLAALRKDMPTARDEGEVFVDQVTELALASDPVRLGVIVSRVRQAAPAWLDWRARPYATTQEAADAYVQMGAGAFDASWENLHDAVLLTVVDRLDTIIDLTGRIEDGR